jgi:hypothetical protein
MFYNSDLATSFAQQRQQDLERTARRYRVAKLARRQRTSRGTPEIRPAPAAARARAA